MPSGCEDEWKIKRLEVAGFGKGRLGTSPFGARAQAFHLSSTSFPTDTATDGEGCSSAWAAAS